ncbi:dephospho-CoA kinase [Aestuariirhabdus sp. Z084]|uniref:dephospho-CoA kinase n=1 Tax=Aestuariirhabdus haliotis TaxID=2918751 RepID=UPI00201B444F|nr:dephospho-CoA kinase [Aestuariirhabdus haliotis]MCL6416084.1 dephospho-CoA kinase [Aestuariirhabdus haliotis]MCL6419348.1 dephospho-CoA kinase [Aestuariirhabdus haliotis]
MYLVGVTGGIGSGKSAVSDYLASKGITVVDADLAARVAVEPGRPGLQTIAQHFGQDILLTNGNLDRAALRARIFEDTSERQWLESLLHPLIAQEIQAQIASSQSPYTILASPLLLETSQHEWVDRILIVDVPQALQLSRTMARDGNTEAQVQAIMDAQLGREARLKHADDRVDNSADITHLHKQLDQLHQQYLRYASESVSGDNNDR